MSTDDEEWTGGDISPDEIDRIGDEPIDGDGLYPFAGLTRWDDPEDTDAMLVPENVWEQGESLKYWAQNKTQHQFRDEDGEPTNVERELPPEVLPKRGLNSMIHELPRATTAEVVWRHPHTGEVIDTAKHNAVINPETAQNIAHDEANVPIGTYAHAISQRVDLSEDGAKNLLAETASLSDALDICENELNLTSDGRREIEGMVTGDDALYHIPTSKYTIINPAAFLRPLAETLQERDLGDSVFGEVRLDRGGGRATLDLFMAGQNVECPVFDSDRPPVVVGLEVGWDFFSDWAVRACGVALDWDCDNRIERMTDREIVKHTGDVDERVDWHEWWSDILNSLDEKRDQLSRFIQQASEMSLSFRDLPDDLDAEYDGLDASLWTALYGYMGLPDYLAEFAGQELRAIAEDPYEPNFWEIHRGATYAVSNHDRSDRQSGGAYEDHARVANDCLFNPAGIQERVEENYTLTHQDDETLAEEGGGLAQIQGAFEDVADRKEQFEEWEEELKSMGIEV